MFDCSRVLEYAKILTVLQSTLARADSAPDLGGRRKKRRGGRGKREGEKRGVLFIKKGKKPVISGVGIGILCAPFSFRVRSDSSIF